MGYRQEMERGTSRNVSNCWKHPSRKGQQQQGGSGRSQEQCWEWSPIGWEHASSGQPHHTGADWASVWACTRDVCVCTGCALGLCVCVCMHVWLFATSWAVARQAPLSMGCPRQEYWSGLPLPPPGDLPNPGSKLYPLCLLHWQADSLPVVPPVKPHTCNSQEKNTSE